MDTELGLGWNELAVELVEHVASFLDANEVACSIRLISKATARKLRRWTRVRLSQPVPQHAFAHRWGPERSTSGLTLKQRQHLLCLVAGSGSILNLQVALAAADCGPVPADVFLAAAVRGHIHIVEWLRQQGHRCDFYGYALDAARAGQRALVHWVLAQEDAPRDGATVMFYTAAAGGHRALCEELLAAGARLRYWWHVERALYDSLADGHTHMTPWLLTLLADHRRVLSYIRLLIHASYSLDLPALRQLYDGHLSEGLSLVTSGDDASEVQEGFAIVAAAALCSPQPDWREKLEWLEGTLGARLQESNPRSALRRITGASEENLVRRPDAIERIAHLGQCVKDRRGLFKSSALLREAVTGGHRAVVRYLLAPEVEGGGPRAGELSAELTEVAASHGYISILKDLLAADCPVQPRTVAGAARNGKLQVLQWLAGPEAGQAAAAVFREAASGPQLLNDAASSGSLELVRWLREERGCKLDEGVLTAGVRSGNVELVEWLVAEGCTMPATGAPYLIAGCNDDLATLRCLRRLGCPWGDPPGRTFAEAVWLPSVVCGMRGGSLPVLQWLVAEGCPVDWDQARRRAAERLRHRAKEENKLVSDWVEAVAAGSIS